MDKKSRVEIDNKLNQVKELMSKNLDQALSELEKIDPKVLPEDLKYDYYYLAGDIHYARDDFDDAIIFYNLALRDSKLSKENKAKIYKNLAGIYCERDSYNEAIESANTALKLSKDNKTISGALHWMALSYRNQDDFNKSISCFLRIIDIYKEKITDNWSKDMIEGAYICLCFDYWKIKNEEKSEFYYNKLTSLKDVELFRLSEAYLCKAHRLYEKRQWKEALDYYNKAIAHMDDEEEKQNYQKYVDDCKGWLAKESK